tara:strand:- start:812 stop:1087 length:276 start_codon:yes stop_codon:yes gene_type:complete
VAAWKRRKLSTEKHLHTKIPSLAKRIFERFNDSLSREFLGAYLLEKLNQLKETVCFWRLNYNEENTNERHGNLTPVIHVARLENSSLQVSH